MTSRLTPLFLRRLLQYLFTAICLLAGVRLYLFCMWAAGQSGAFVARPPVAEGFLPISAVMALKFYLFTGLFDPVHPAGLTILMAALLASLLLRKGFCAFICPVGLASDLLSGLGKRLGFGGAGPRWLDLAARQLKFVLLAACLYFFLSMPLMAMRGYLMGEHNIAADASMLRFFLAPSPTTLIVLGVLAVGTLLARNVWCRWLCPYGALLGLAALFGPTAVRRDDGPCTKCGRCERACPSGILIRRKTDVRAPECIGCAQCVGACPEPGALEVRAMGKTISWRWLGLGTAGVILAAWLIAEATGHWASALPLEMTKPIYGAIFRTL
ncbi:4Fe-4S binding protein [Fundidesulfovibrio agrisoli]|uniref:4Fe-4S binding protein n=1 Tax=Fundidesulfovibrio agrisoli TaxID=2922717 RepID=UPI001FAC5F25|nr:4Fe-4S binding protein [Fundidesulfovibrio agrisoli]